jgi:hypothetical protein
MVVIPNKLVQGSKMHVDLEPKRMKFTSRNQIGWTYARLMANEAKTLTKLAVNVAVSLGLMGATILWSTWFMVPFLVSAFYVFKTHGDYSAAWSVRYKFGRKRVTRIDDEVMEREPTRGPLTLIGEDYKFRNTFPTEEGMFY